MKALLAFAGLAVLLGLVGCTTPQVSIPVWQPAQFDLSLTRRIAIPAFQGPLPHAALARNQVAQGIAAGQNCSVPDEKTIAQEMPATVVYQREDASVDVRLLLEQARRAGFDLLLVGRVECQGIGNASLHLGNSTLGIAIAMQVIDVRTGAIQGDIKVDRKWQGVLSRQPEAKNSRNTLFAALNREVSREVAQKFTAGTKPVPVALAQPSDGDDAAAIEAGTTAANIGNWESAAASFEQARVANPQSYAANYNLALSCEAQFIYAAARHWYSQALSCRASQECRDALARLDQSSINYDIAMRQLHPQQVARIPPTGSGSSGAFGGDRLSHSARSTHPIALEANHR